MKRILFTALITLFSTQAFADTYSVFVCRNHHCRYITNIYPSFQGWRHTNAGWTHSCINAWWLSDSFACSHN